MPCLDSIYTDKKFDERNCIAESKKKIESGDKSYFDDLCQLIEQISLNIKDFLIFYR